MKPILEASRPRHSLLDEDRQSLVARLRRLLVQDGAREAWLIGSYARQTAGPWSDLDLIVICDTDLAFPERSRLFPSLRELDLPVDLLVYTPKEFARMEEHPTGFWRATQQERVRLV
jgi:predicted nucleotidyltransferase